MNFNLPGFDHMELWELRRTIADLEFQLQVVQSFLERAHSEMKHRKQEKKEGLVFLSGGPPNSDDEFGRSH